MGAVGSFLRHVPNSADNDPFNKAAREKLDNLDGKPHYDESPDAPFEHQSPERQRASYEGLLRLDSNHAENRAAADEFILLHPEVIDHVANGNLFNATLKTMFGDVVHTHDQFERAYAVLRVSNALELDQAEIVKQQQAEAKAKRKAAQDKRNFEAKRQFNPEEDYSNLSLDEIRQRADVETQRELERRAYQEGLR